MNKAKGYRLMGALVLGVILLGAQTGFAQVAGRVTSTGGAPIFEATVQIWDSYPGGSILVSGLTDAAGAFSFGGPGSNYDVRVTKNGSYPTVIRDLPDPTTNLLVHLAAIPTVEVNPTVADYWGSSIPFLGSNILLGDVIEARDQGGVTTGTTQNVLNNGVYLIHVYGNMAGTPEDEGHEQNEEVSFLINGLPAVVTGGAPLYAGNIFPPSTEAPLIGAASAPGATVTGQTDAVGEAGTSVFIVYQLRNTGGTAATYDISYENDNGWTMSHTNNKGVGIGLDPGESSDIVLEVQIPPGAPDQLLEVRLWATDGTYGPSNAGAHTTLEVSTFSGIWDGESGGDGLLPSTFSLAQNYPNPFNPSTLISFNLEYAGHARLEVINILGQSVRVLVDEFRQAGISTVVWDSRDERGSQVPTGVYFYRLVQDNQSQVRKMVLLK